MIRSARRSRILLVEDDPDRIALTLRAFQRATPPPEIVVARDGQQALDYLFGVGPFAGREPWLAPDVVLLDLGLPRVSGFDVLRQMRAADRTRRVPVVILSSSCEEKDIATSYEIGANSYLQKPVDFTRFVEETRLLSQYWLGMNQPPHPV